MSLIDEAGVLELLAPLPERESDAWRKLLRGANVSPLAATGVIDDAAEGFIPKEVAHALNISFGAYRNHRYRTMQATGCSNMEQVIARALRGGWFPEPLDTSEHPPRTISVPKRQQLQLRALGMSQAEIVTVLDTSPASVRNGLAYTTFALGANSLEHAVRIAWEHEMLPVAVPEHELMSTVSAA